MNLDDLLAEAAAEELSELDEARARRTARAAIEEYFRRLRDGIPIRSDVVLSDPALMTESERICRAAALAQLGTIMWTPGRAELLWSVEMSRICGRAQHPAGGSVRELLAIVDPRDRAELTRQVRSAWRAVEEREVTVRVRRPDGTVAHVHWYIEVTDEDRTEPTRIVATGQDVTGIETARQERRRRRLRRETVQPDLTEVDPVTGLLSRRRFADEVGRSTRTETGTLLVIYAPPYIRRSSDSDSGRDERLSAAAAGVLRSVAGPMDKCGVLGRHEFGLLMPHTTFCTAREQVEEVLQRLQDTRFMADSARLDAYGGLVQYDYRAAIESVDLLFDAETAWRQAKARDERLHALRRPPTAAGRRKAAREEIRAAVEAGRFTLYAQPLRDLQLNRTTRHEILLRVLDDVGRPQPPANFLELAEHVDEILAVDKWVIENALRMIGRGPQTSHYQLNISGRSLADPMLLTHLKVAVDRFGVAPDRLTVEITETAAIGNLMIARRFADGVRELGCQVALDDFGTGNTPLSFLTQLPVDLVKIDGSFIRDLAGNAATQAVVEGLVGTCRRLGIRTAAEHVRDDETIDLLRRYGVDFAQGYHVGEPELMVVRPRTTKSIELALFSPGERPRAM